MAADLFNFSVFCREDTLALADLRDSGFAENFLINRWGRYVHEMGKSST